MQHAQLYSHVYVTYKSSTIVEHAHHHYTHVLFKCVETYWCMVRSSLEMGSCRNAHICCLASPLLSAAGGNAAAALFSASLISRKS